MSKEIEAKKKAAVEPGTLPAHIAKAVGDMAGLFEKSGKMAYSEILSDVKKTVSTKLANHRSNLLQDIKNEFGMRGMTEASQHCSAWMEAVVSDLLHSGFEPLADAIKGLYDPSQQEQIQKASVEASVADDKKTQSARLLVLAMDTHKRGLTSVARDLFTYAAEHKDASEMTKMLEEIASADLVMPEAVIAEPAKEPVMEAPKAAPVAVSIPVVTESLLSASQIAKAKAIANKIAASGHSDLAKRVFAALK